MSLNQSTSSTLPELARRLNLMVRGWVNYYGAFYPEALKRFLIRIDLRLGGWARNKYKLLRGHKRQSWRSSGDVEKSSSAVRALGFLFGERQARRAV
ncbi:MAG: hypothetical protein IPP36_07650 [Nitrosomonadales bacterium]|nr:hypothetical protein [Nitrosomonadales bacterium]